MPRRSKHKCDNFKDQWKITNGGILRCVCGDEQQQPVVDAVAGREKDHYYVPGPPNPSALTDDHPAGKTDTSISAFESTNRAKGQRQVQALITASVDGLTAEQAADAMGVGQATTSARFNELRRAGIIRRYMRRATHSGRSAWAHKIVAGR